MTISAIVPTIGRPDSLDRLAASLAAQSHPIVEIIVADGSGTGDTERVVEKWRATGLPIRRIAVAPPNAVGQRKAAIAQASGRYLLLLDDDVELDPRCVEEMMAAMQSAPGVVGVIADFSNESWSRPTRAWRWYLRWFHGVADGGWQGKVLGPLLRFGFHDRSSPGDMDWISSGSSLVERAAYDRAGGFSDFFLHRCTMNEDVDLGIRLRRHGRILFWPAARLAHHHAPQGRVSPALAAEDDLFNRFFVLTRTSGVSSPRALWLVVQFLLIESCSNMAGMLRRWNVASVAALLAGRLRGLVRIVRTL